MKNILGVSCTVMLSFLCVLKSEKCTIEEFSTEFVEEGQPLGIDCFFSKILQHENYSLSWYINGSETPISKQLSSRIHQRDSMLWFIPAARNDSGIYECILRYATTCYKGVARVLVFESSTSHCFNKNLFYRQNIPLSIGSKIVCPHMSSFGQDLAIKWYKECEPLPVERFEALHTDLIIKDMTRNDSGKYQCRTIYSYRGKKYDVSRNIDVTVLANPQKKRTEILYPRNNTIEAEIGSSLILDCNVSNYRDNFISISWRVNNTQVDHLFKGRIREGIQKDLEEGTLSVVSLNITELRKEDYDQLFVCQAGKVAAYISIQHPYKNIFGLVALILLILIPILICVLFKVEIILWYRKSCLPFLHKKVSDGKIYDAYVMYPKNSTQNCFALKVLPEVLEKKCGYNLFILGRDDLPGQAVVNVIDETIKQSRRLIIILVPGSSNFNLLEDAPEQQIALYNALLNESAGMKVILIEMDKIKDYSSMPESIRYIKQKRGAIRWKGDLSKKNSYSANTTFWKKVRYHMPPGNQVSPELPLVPTFLNSIKP